MSPLFLRQWIDPDFSVQDAADIFIVENVAIPAGQPQTDSADYDGTENGLFSSRERKYFPLNRTGRDFVFDRFDDGFSMSRFGADDAGGINPAERLVEACFSSFAGMVCRQNGDIFLAFQIIIGNAG